MSIHHNINIPAVDVERLWGAASIKVKGSTSPTEHAYWRGVRNTFEQIGMAEPPAHNAFIAALAAGFDEDEDARGGEC